ncbi:Uncharacterised protein [Chlamydia abortus]|nr:Uncharacterised protein [Chlamydia abortus]
MVISKEARVVDDPVIREEVFVYGVSKQIKDHCSSNATIRKGIRLMKRGAAMSWSARYPFRIIFTRIVDYVRVFCA